MRINDQTIGLLARLARAASTRHRVTATNLANINTPGYRAKKLKFEDAFAEAIRGGNVDRALELEGEVVEKEGAKEKADGNTVHMEEELGDLQKNALAHQFFSSMLQQKLRSIRAAITGGQ
jgi:flagellar basal-body rod protein FlgB